jgi:hypothetical protein
VAGRAEAAGTADAGAAASPKPAAKAESQPRPEKRANLADAEVGEDLAVSTYRRAVAGEKTDSISARFTAEQDALLLQLGFRIQTGSGGKHYWLRTAKSKADSTLAKLKAPGLDARASVRPTPSGDSVEIEVH